MDKNDKRDMIKYLHLKGLTDIKEVLVDHVPSNATMYRWVAVSQQDRQSTEDNHCYGRLVETWTDDNV